MTTIFNVENIIRKKDYCIDSCMTLQNFENNKIMNLNIFF